MHKQTNVLNYQSYDLHFPSHCFVIILLNLISSVLHFNPVINDQGK